MKATDRICGIDVGDDPWNERRNKDIISFNEAKVFLENKVYTYNRKIELLISAYETALNHPDRVGELRPNIEQRKEDLLK